MGVAKGPTALLQKTRRGLSRGLESSSEGPPEKKEQTGKEAIIFHPVKMRNTQRRRVQVRVKRDGARRRGCGHLSGHDESNPRPLSAIRPRCMVGTKAISGSDKWPVTFGASYRS